jgi:para-aminobenzoate synthetase component 1
VNKIKIYNPSELSENINELGRRKVSFVFLIDFDCRSAFIEEIEKINPAEFLYNFDGRTNTADLVNSNKYKHTSKTPLLKVFPIKKEKYLQAFSNVLKHINYGDSYLLNLTFQTEIQTELTLEDIFMYSNSKCKILLPDYFVCFSPEPFVFIQDGKIISFPMKGTISSEIENAVKTLLEDEKELAEHYTIVDLIRNDLSIVSENVKVDSFRYVEKIKTIKGDLLQTSSQISGELNENWNEILGDILLKLLPAGSVTGAPKQKTVEIIKEVENYNRGFYTGIAGIYDGLSLKSYVMIRFIEKDNDKLYFKSGGGITSKSDFDKEYAELIEKIYVPIA